MKTTRSTSTPKPPSRYSLAILNGLQGTPIYGGTVDPATIRRNRAANKVARRSRRVNRKRGA